MFSWSSRPGKPNCMTHMTKPASRDAGFDLVDTGFRPCGLHEAFELVFEAGNASAAIQVRAPITGPGWV